MRTNLPVVSVGPIAHGGHCVARLDGQVVFVRHALPGEQVSIRITERTKRFLRADAVEVLAAAPGRVDPPCRFAGQCGGCDFQHADLNTQAHLLTTVLREQLQRLAGWAWDGEVEQVSVPNQADSHGTGWRTRVTWAVDQQGRLGLRPHRSHDVVAIDRCMIAHPDIPDVSRHRFDTGSVESIVSSVGERMLVTDASVSDDWAEVADAVVATTGQSRVGRPFLTEEVRDRKFRVRGSGFWQIHPSAATTLVDAVMEAADIHSGDRVVDLYAGVGLFTAFAAEATGPTGAVVWVESDRAARADAEHNLAEFGHVTFVTGRTEKVLRRRDFGATGMGDAGVIILDPPRSGAKAAVAPLAALAPRRIVYVACDPAAFARDVGSFARHGYELESLRGFALFPMTHHVECVGVLTPAESNRSR